MLVWKRDRAWLGTEPCWFETEPCMGGSGTVPSWERDSAWLGTVCYYVADTELSLKRMDIN